MRGSANFACKMIVLSVEYSKTSPVSTRALYGKTCHALTMLRVGYTARDPSRLDYWWQETPDLSCCAQRSVSLPTDTDPSLRSG